MSWTFRYRVTAIVLGGFFLGVPLAMGGAAAARDRQVILEVSSGKSHPAAVPVARTARPAPPTGPSRLSRPRTPATLAAGTARPGAVVPASPHRTEPAVQLPPNDPNFDQPRPVHPSTERPRTVRPSTDRPQAHRTGASRPSVRHTRSRATGTSGWTRQHQATGGGTRLKTRVKATTGTAGTAAGGRAGGTGVPAPAGVPRPDVTPMSAGAEPPTPALSQSAAAEPVTAMRPMRPMPPGNRIGLLGVIAAVCAVGVAIAAIRSIVFKRANDRIMA